MADRPIHDMLQAAALRTRGHMPGHGGLAPFPVGDLYELDTTETDATDDLYSPVHAILEAQEQYAAAAGAKATVFLHNGSTQGIHAMLEAELRDGDTVILPRNAHLSAQAACIIGGLRVSWICLRQTQDGYSYIAEDDVLEALKKTPEAKCLLLTRPDYYGGCIPLERIAREARRRGVRLVVDEAHGAHFPWLNGISSAGDFGADYWVQSVHKTLPGLTGSAVLHASSAAHMKSAMRVIRREQTSSPSFLLLQSVDDSRAYMEERGVRHLEQLAQTLQNVKRSLSEIGYGNPQEAWTKETGYCFDPLHLVIRAPQGGKKLMKQLSELSYDVEMADRNQVVCLYGAGMQPEVVYRLESLLKRVRGFGKDAALFDTLPPIPKAVMPLRVAALSDTEYINYRQAQDRICAQAAGLYPPGIPLVVPGEKISREVIEILGNNTPNDRFGMEGDMMLCVRQ